MQAATVSSPRFTAFTVTVTDAHIEAIFAGGITFANKGQPRVNWLTKAKTITISYEIFIEAHSAFLSTGFFNQGAHSYSKSALDQRAKVGRYCSLGSNITVIPASHPMERLSTCGLDYADFDVHPKGFTKVRHRQAPMKLTIGNDVWIGDSAMLGRGITVGHGAVIGARAIVTKDVPPYAIVAGSPAIVRRYRFDEETIDRLLKSEWWNIDPSGLTTLDTTRVPAFLDGFEALRNEGRLIPYQPRVTALHEIFRPIGSPFRR